MVPSSAQVDYMRIRVSFHGAGFARERVNVLHMTDSVITCFQTLLMENDGRETPPGAWMGFAICPWHKHHATSAKNVRLWPSERFAMSFRDVTGLRSQPE